MSDGLTRQSQNHSLQNPKPFSSIGFGAAVVEEDEQRRTGRGLEAKAKVQSPWIKRFRVLTLALDAQSPVFGFARLSIAM